MNGSAGTAAFLARAVLSLVGGLVGYALAVVLLDRGLLTGPNNLLYLTLLGVLCAYLLGGTVAQRTARLWDGLVQRASKTPPEAVLAAGSGATIALLITVLLNNLLANVPGFTWYWSLLIAVLLVTAASSFFVANRHLFPFSRATAHPPPRTSGSHDKVVDTSAIIDGRIADVADANFLDGSLLVPNFVLSELQHIADSDDPLRRQRGRRGLEVLDRIAREQLVPTQVIHDDPESSMPVDEKLVRVCQVRGADLITTDYNLSRVAGLQGVRVLNLHQLANAVKATFLPGEKLSLNIVRPGREQGQGLAYLEDGTMVVVEDAGELVGQTVAAVVTSSLQTNMGRMIFARPDVRAEEAG
ncbi:MAG TPA: PIN domain-containing protein [Trueperaceae bacterium]|nr:PIN domain-containing protein [Trueperaceae bacterium]